MQRPGQLRGRGKSSLAIGPGGQGAWCREGPGASTHQQPGGWRGGWSPGWVVDYRCPLMGQLMRMLLMGTAYESASEPREPESFFPFLISQFNSFVFSIPSLYSLCFPDSVTWMGR